MNNRRFSPAVILLIAAGAGAGILLILVLLAKTFRKRVLILLLILILIGLTNLYFQFQLLSQNKTILHRISLIREKLTALLPISKQELSQSELKHTKTQPEINQEQSAASAASSTTEHPSPTLKHTPTPPSVPQTPAAPAAGVPLKIINAASLYYKEVKPEFVVCETLSDYELSGENLYLSSHRLGIIMTLDQLKGTAYDSVFCFYTTAGEPAPVRSRFQLTFVQTPAKVIPKYQKGQYQLVQKGTIIITVEEHI